MATQSALQCCPTFTHSRTHPHTDGGVKHGRSNLPVTSQPAVPPEPRVAHITFTNLLHLDPALLLPHSFPFKGSGRPQNPPVPGQNHQWAWPGLAWGPWDPSPARGPSTLESVVRTNGGGISISPGRVGG